MFQICLHLSPCRIQKMGWRCSPQSWDRGSMLAGRTYSITPSSIRRSISCWNASRESPGGISLKAAAVWGGEGCMSHISEKPCLHTVVKNLSVHMWCARCDLLRTFPATGPDVVLNLSTTSGGSQTLSPCDVGCVGCSMETAEVALALRAERLLPGQLLSNSVSWLWLSRALYQCSPDRGNGGALPAPDCRSAT